MNFAPKLLGYVFRYIRQLTFSVIRVVRPYFSTKLLFFKVGFSVNSWQMAQLAQVAQLAQLEQLAELAECGLQFMIMIQGKKLK